MFSSAKRINSAVEDMLETFIYIKKSKEPRMDPCGTPQSIFFLFEGRSLNWTYCCLLDWDFLVQFNAQPRTP